MNFLAPETSHIMALKIKDYIIFSLLLVHHYWRLIVDDHSYSGPGLSGWVARSQRVRLRRRLGILWLIVYMVQTSCIPIYFSDYYTLHPTTKVAIFRPVWTPEQASCFIYKHISCLITVVHCGCTTDRIKKMLLSFKFVFEMPEVKSTEVLLQERSYSLPVQRRLWRHRMRQWCWLWKWLLSRWSMWRLSVIHNHHSNYSRMCRSFPYNYHCRLPYVVAIVAKVNQGRTGRS
jgi:hypothetical protein